MSPRTGSARAAAVVLLLATVLAGIAAGTAASPALADEPRRVTYRPPADAGIVDPFRAPTSAYGPGNRGVDLATAPGDPIVAAADGEVVFAGSVGGSRHVVVLHADGIRTSYSFLATTTVARGRRVAAGDVVGLAEGTVHFGARNGDVYLDPLRLLGGGVPEVRLVPDHPRSEREERSLVRQSLALLGRGLNRAASLTGATAGWLAGTAGSAAAATVDAALRAAGLADLASVLAQIPAEEIARYGLPLVLEAIKAVAEWRASLTRCTSKSAPAPRVRGRRLIVRVGGLHSATGKGGITRFSPARYGYAKADIVDFSYRGGSLPYAERDTEGDLRVPAHLLAERLRDLAREHPGVPIDIVAHSQGGLVARGALAEIGAPGPGKPYISNLVMLATPNHGAIAATTATNLRRTPAGRVVADSADRLLGTNTDAEAVPDLAEGSSYLGSLPPLPKWLQATTIAARRDLAAAGRTVRLEGADNRTVEVGTLSAHDHDDLPGSAAGARETALALAGRPATCRTLEEAIVDFGQPELVGLAERVAGAVAVDLAARGPGPRRP